MDIIRIVLSVAVMFALILPGYILRKTKMLNDAAVTGFVVVLLYACQPFLSVKYFLLSDISDPVALFANMGWAFLLGAAGLIVTAAVTSLIFFRMKDRDRARVYAAASTFSNCGFLGLPLLQIVSGGDPYAMVYGTVFIIAFNMMLWTVGIYMLSGDVKAIRPHKAVFNPAVLPLAFALPLFFIPSINIFNAGAFPSLAPLSKPVTFFADMSAPVSMTIAGIRLADMPIKAVFTDRGSYAAAACRLLLSPLLMLLIALPLRNACPFATETARYLLVVPVVMLAMPTAASVIAFSEKFDRDSRAATKALLSATLLSMLTLPFALILLNHLFL